MGFGKGHKKLGGRKRGTPNKSTTELKDAILAAAESANEEGLVGYLTWLAKEEPASFSSLLGKLLPKDVNVEVDGELAVKIVRRYTKPKDEPVA